MQRTQSRPLYKVTAHELLPCQPWACSDANASSMTKNPGRSYPILQLYSRIPASSRPMRVHRAGSLGSSAHKAEDLQSGKAASFRTQRQAAGMHKAQSTFRDERNESPTCSCLVLLCICLPGTSAKAQNKAKPRNCCGRQAALSTMSVIAETEMPTTSLQYRSYASNSLVNLTCRPERYRASTQQWRRASRAAGHLEINAWA